MQFLNLSLKAKLTLIIALVSAFSLLLAGIAFLQYEKVLVRRELVRDRNTLAEMIGINSALALRSGNRASVSDTLGAMRAEPSILYASVFAADGSVFASYVRTHQGSGFVPPSLRPDGAYYENGSLILFRSVITEANEKIGVVCIQSDLKEENERMVNRSVILLLIILGSFLIALLLSARMQHVFSRPILHLLQVESRVSREKTTPSARRNMPPMSWGA